MFRQALLLSLALSVGCGDEPASAPDAGPTTDGGADDAGSIFDAAIEGDAGGDASTPDASMPVVTRETFCARFTEARCAGHESCCELAGRSYGSVAACIEAQLDGCTAIFAGADWDDGTLTFDAVAAAEVLVEAERTAAECTAGASAADLFRRATYDVALGSATEGSCASAGADEEPSAAYRCARDEGYACYTRIEGGLISTCEMFAAESESCASAPCERTFFCNADRVCAPRGEGGATCRNGRDLDCLYGACTDGTCAAPSLCVRR